MWISKTLLSFVLRILVQQSYKYIISIKYKIKTFTTKQQKKTNNYNLMNVRFYPMEIFSAGTRGF